MNTFDLLKKLAQRGVRLRAADGRLIVRAAEGVLDVATREELAAHKGELLRLLGSQADADSSDRPSFSTANPYAESPLSYQQQRIWYIQRTEPESSVYNVTGAFRLSGALNVDALGSALRAFFSRHSVLSSYTIERDGVPFQAYRQDLKAPIEHHDFSSYPDQERDAYLLDWIERHERIPFDIGEPPLIRFYVVKLGANEHVILLVAHHNVWDGWGFDLFLEEIEELYTSRVEQRSVQLAPPRASYNDFVRWQDALLAGPDGRALDDFWREELSGDLPDLDMPTDRPRPPLLNLDGARAKIRLGKQVLESVRSLARANGATNFMVLLAAFEALLFKYTRQQELIVATPTQGRALPEFESVVGFFVNTLLLRTRLDGDPTFAEFLEQIRDVCLRSFDHQQMPFEQLVREYGRRDLSRTPIFQTMFTHQFTAGRIGNWGSVQVRSLPRGTQVTYTDMSMWLREYQDYIDGGVDYRVDLFDAETMAAFINRYEQLLIAATSNPGLKLSSLPFVLEDERARLLTNKRGDDDPELADGSFLDWVANQVRRNGTRIAVVDEHGNEWTYSELWARAGRIADALVQRGVESRSLIGVMLDRSADLLAVLLGVLRSGAAYLPVDPEYPDDRLRYVFEDGNVALTVSDQPPLDVPGLQTVTPEQLLEEGAEEFAGAVPGRDDLAYVIYTSGSTGLPKGVEITHGALRNFLGAMRLQPGMRDDDTLLAVTTLSFDISALEIYLPLCAGGQVAIVDSETALDGSNLVHCLERYDVTMMQATPATWRMLIDAGWDSGLKKILCGGEPLPAELAAALTVRCDEVWNMYGPTETTVWSTIDRVRAGAEIRVGRPIANTQVYVLDDVGELVPDGVSGEIWIGGAGVARGYRNRPELTAERFTADPFRLEGRMYRTGDLGRWRRDGRLEHLGRLDFQVKVHGFRIELGEIESALGAIAEIRQAVVAALGDGGDRYLVGYVIFEESQDLLAGEIRRALARTLPHYMVPGLIVPLTELPLTPNGKIDRKALPDPLQGARQDREFEPPQGTAEKQIAAVWSELLKTDQVGRHDNFFELGGHSLLAIRAVAEIRRRIDREIDPRAFFFRTLAQISTGGDGDTQTHIAEAG